MITRSRSQGLLFGALIGPTGLGIAAPGVALPDLGRDLGLTRPQTAWTLAAFALMLAIGFVLSGRLAERRGMRFVIIVGAVLLAVGSVLAAGSFSFASLVAGRLLQGAGAGAVSIAALGTINEVVAVEARAKVLAIMTAVIAALSGSGALIGGLLVDSAGWRSVLALPALSLLAVPIALTMAPRSSSTRAAFDVRGAGLLTVAAAGLVLVLQSKTTGLPGWLSTTVGVVSVLALFGVTLHVRARPDGFLPRSLVVDRLFVRLCVLGGLLFGAYLAMQFVVPAAIGGLTGWSALRIGVVLLPAALCGVVASRLAGVALRHGHAHAVLLALAVIAVVGMAVAAAAPSVVTYVIALGATVAGYAGGQVTLLDIVPLAVPGPRVVSAVAMFNFVFFFGGAVGSAAAATLTDSISLRTTSLLLAVLPLVAVLLALPRVVPGVVQAREDSAEVQLNV